MSSNICYCKLFGDRVTLFSLEVQVSHLGSKRGSIEHTVSAVEGCTVRTDRVLVGHALFYSYFMLASIRAVGRPLIKAHAVVEVGFFWAN